MINYYIKMKIFKCIFLSFIILNCICEDKEECTNLNEEYSCNLSDQTEYPESWDERRIIPGMLALIQEQDKKIKDQEAEIEDLKSRLEKLEHAIMNITR